MGNRTAKFISALVGSIIAGAPLAAVSQNAPSASSTANAAADCLASPKSTAPQGQHWHYRLDRATKRQCWYLRAEGGKATQSAQATADTPNADPAAPPSLQNARAEYIAPQIGAAPGSPNMTAPAPAATNAPPVTQQPPGAIADNNAQQPAVAARWPDASTTSAAPAPQPAPATQPSAKPAKAGAPVVLAAAEIPADKPTGSLQMLLLVIGGALAIAGILASVIYRFAGGRARVRVQANDHRRVNWDDREPQNRDEGRAPWLEGKPAVTPRAQPPRPIDFDAARPQAAQLAAIDRKIDMIEAHEPAGVTEVAESGEPEIAAFDREFEIEARAPRLAADQADSNEEPAGRDEDAVNIDIITTMLERLLQEGPRLKQPGLGSNPGSNPGSNLGAGLANLARNQRGQSAARA
ncbi:hypothetical protein XI09_36180 [Bradyrhizobium sp. CCBAU 11386]|uniref:hypothetical protein n=1 Tax=Bradyrhizobium sp. CCBAU 11386 TaxID=1630837 RepID=UPI0023024C12|nr:hypothetical protein [Bradyrhizobium sp. CCBAU 11386]MDA9509993.1 hypothetical protein [Bradyrhizobium sp. CCBAU 11386]